jgi:hypothetical protein
MRLERIDMRTIAGRVWGYRYVILAVVWLLYIINYFDRIAVLTFLPYIQKDWALTAVQVGQLASVLFFAYAIAQISAGYRADRIGPKQGHGARDRGLHDGDGADRSTSVARRREGPGYLILRHVVGGCAGHRARHLTALPAVAAREAAHRDPGADWGRSRGEAPGRRDVSWTQSPGRATACERWRD